MVNHQNFHDWFIPKKEKGSQSRLNIISQKYPITSTE